MPEISKEASMSEKQFTTDGFRVAAKRAAKSFEDADSLSGSYRDVVLAALKIAAIATDRIVFDACKLSPDEQLSLEKRILAVGGFIGVVAPPPHLAASASSPEPEEPAKPDRNRDRLLALLLNRRIDHHDVNACEAEAWGDGLPECVKYHNGQAKAYRAALEALERDAPSSRHSDGERR